MSGRQSDADSAGIQSALSGNASDGTDFAEVVAGGGDPDAGEVDFVGGVAGGLAAVAAVRNWYASSSQGK